MNEQLAKLNERFDDVVLGVLGPLRMSKRIDTEAMAELKSILDELRAVLSGEENVPRKLTGELWDVFCSMLAEADHAKDPGPILAEAWDIQERLRHIFGPMY
jgi:hypothetical protein